MHGVVPEWLDMSMTAEDRRRGARIDGDAHLWRAELALAGLMTVALASALAVGAGLALMAGATLGLVAAGFASWLGPRLAAYRCERRVLRVISTVSDDPSPHFLTDGDGLPLAQSPAAYALSGDGRAPDLECWLSPHLASPGSALASLRRVATATASATKVVRTGQDHAKIIVRRVRNDLLLWRVEQFPDAAGVEALPQAETQAPLGKSIEPSAPGSLSSLEEALPVPVLKIAGDGSIRTANAAARILFRLDGPDYPPFYDLAEGMGRPVSHWLRDAMEGHGLNRPEVMRFAAKEGDRFLQVTLGRVEAEEEALILASFHDATELKSLEAQFVQSQKMQAIGQLAGGVAHDFNNLLTAISGHCDLLLLRHDEGDPDFADLMQISQNANRAASLVGQLLAFSRKQTMKAQIIDLADAMSDLTHLLNRLVGEKTALDLNIGTLRKVIRADRRQFEQVVMNLVVNARDAMPDGGTVRIDVDETHLDDPLQRDRVEMPAGSYITIRVSDQGAGIAPDALPKIFEPFYTTKKTGEGTGLGLSTAYGIVKQSGGYIFADSELGAGTCFTLYFPASDRLVVKEEVQDASATRPRAPSGEGVVLLVEDEAPVRAFAARALRMKGYTVIEASDAEQALTRLSEPDLHVDLFVTDVIMPGLDGPSWVRQALKDRPNTRIVFVSGYAEESLAENQARVPNSVFLPKPFSLSDLTTVVHQQMTA